MFSFVPIKCKNEKAREKEEEITKACGKLYDSHKNVIVRIYMLCIIYSMCLFFTLFYRAIFLKSIQLHREMVVCAAQEKKNNKKKSHWKKCITQKTKGATETSASVTPSQQKNRIYSQRLPINSSLHTTRVSCKTPAKSGKKNYSSGAFWFFSEKPLFFTPLLTREAEQAAVHALDWTKLLLKLSQGRDAPKI